ncbi:MAG: type II secretion system protein GspD [Opitutaceae bacterium]
MFHLLLTSTLRSAGYLSAFCLTLLLSVNQVVAVEVTSASILEDETGSLDRALGDNYSERLANFESQLISRDESDKEVFIYSCKYVQATTIRRVLEEFISSDGMVADSAESDQIVISDRRSNIEMLKTIIKELDQAVPQILVEARIVELNIESDLEKEVDLFYKDMGLDAARDFLDSSGDVIEGGTLGSLLDVAGAASSPTQGAFLNSQVWTDGDQSLNLFLRYLETNGKATILSAPNLIIQRGKEGSIVTGEEVPILSQTTSSGGVTTSTEFKSVGIKLSVKPTMISGDRVRLEVNPEVSTVTGFSDAGDVSNPIIAVRQARTELEVRDGQLISMAGLLQSTKRDTRRRTPILSNVPILGSLFKSDRKQNEQTQLIIFLSIKILPFGEDTIIRPDSLNPKIQQTIDSIEASNDESVKDPSIINDVKHLLDIGVSE